jgi:capsular exopolysaccharide synthesis family protein
VGYLPSVMAEIRIWELAKELGLSTAETVDELKSLGVERVTPISGVDHSDAQRLRARMAERTRPEPDSSYDDHPPLATPIRKAETESRTSPNRTEFEELISETEREEQKQKTSGPPQRAEDIALEKPARTENIPINEPARTEDMILNEGDAPQSSEASRSETGRPEVHIEPVEATAPAAVTAPVGPPVATRWEPGQRAQRPLDEMLLVLRLHRPMLIVTTLLMVAVSIVISLLQEPLYESEASILVRPLTEGSGLGARSLSPNMATEAEILGSEIVAQKVIEDLELSESPRELLLALSVDTPTDTEILTIKSSHSDPLEAQRRAQSFAESFLAHRSEEATRGLAALTQAIEEELEVLRQKLQDVNQRIQAAETSEERSALQSQANLLQTLTVERELSLTSLQREPNVGGIVQPASLTRKPVRPNHPRNVGLGLLAGLAVAMSLAFLKENLGDRLRTKNEAELALGAPILATIPAVSGWRKRKSPLLVTAKQPDSAAAEAYRALGMNVLTAVRGATNRSLLVTASDWGDGVTTTVANLGVVLASLGFKVVLVSADLRHPRLHEFFGLPNSLGITDVLTNDAPLEKVVQQVSPNLRLIASGPGHANPAELLGSDGVRRTLELAAVWADLILVDSAPVGPTSDPVILGQTIGNVLFVIGPLGTGRDTVVTSGERLKTAGIQLIGGVVNNLDRTRMRGFVGN